MKYDVIVVGGGPAGIISAVTAKKYYSDKKFLLIKSVGAGVVPCGIPYMFSTLKNCEDNALGNKPLEANDIDVEVNEVISIDKDSKKIHTKNGKVFEYDKLVLSIGSKPMTPPIEGIHKQGIYPVFKEMNHLKSLKDDIKKDKNIVIIGGGFIGVEFADELSMMKGKKVTLIELMPSILSNSFDEEFSKLAIDELKKSKVKIINEKKVVSFDGDERVTAVNLSDGTKIPCEVVILGMGAIPNSDVASKAGLDIGKSKGILVDEYLRTSNKDIFAVGDCCEKKDYFTRKKIPVMLASTACAEARILGANLYGIKIIRENKGTIAIYSTKLGDLTLGSAGLTESFAEKEGFDIIVGNSESIDKHPALMPDVNKVKVKLIFSKYSGVLLGGQVAGGESAGELINVIGLAIQKNVIAEELETLQVATHPKLTSAPTTYPLIIAAQDAIMKMMK
ncbi:pyridine nucleotide-disulfide oxidoreductase [Candidatus Woesearchaeota archaeon]|nr:MAG: pyridine nucleotide-disulfide oxidoreductase [Candidatus Woesearchaeota archaeon]